jgi:hypothetical protein
MAATPNIVIARAMIRNTLFMVWSSFPLGLGKSDQVQDPKPTGPRLGARPPQEKIGADFGVPRYCFFSRDAWSAVIAVAALNGPSVGVQTEAVIHRMRLGR